VVDFLELKFSDVSSFYLFMQVKLKILSEQNGKQPQSQKGHQHMFPPRVGETKKTRALWLTNLFNFYTTFFFGMLLIFIVRDQGLQYFPSQKSELDSFWQLWGFLKVV